MDFNQIKQNHRGLAGVLAVFVIVLTIFFIVGIFNEIKENRYIGQDVEARNTITVSGEGEIYVKPDLALMNFSVVAEANTVAEAMSKNVEKMNNIIKFMKEQGVEEKDLKTTYFNIYPRYEYRKTGSEIYPYPPGKRILVGYEVSQQLQVKIRELDKLGRIIEGAVDVGANQIGDLQFTIDNQEEIKKQAREKAIKKAKSKAKELAEQLDVRLIRITNFSESGATPQFYAFEKSALAMPGAEETPQIETGENKIKATVTLTYEID